MATVSGLAKDTYRNVSLEEGDLLIFSSIEILGNETTIENWLKAYKARKIKI